MRFIFSYILFFLSANTLLAQHPAVIQLSEKEGLPDIEFYGITEDHQGFIWLAADKGLFRYDGKRFKNYTHPGKRGLSVFGIMLDKKGRVWCNNITGQFFVIENDSMKLFADLREFVKTGLPSFYVDGDGHIITSTDVGIYRINTLTAEPEVLHDSEEFLKNSPRVVNRNSNRIILVGNNKIFELAEGSFDFKTRITPMKYSGIYAIAYEFKNRLMVLSTTEGVSFLHIWDDNAEEFIPAKIPGELAARRIVNMHEIDGLLWLVTDKGVFVADIQQGQLLVKDHYLENYYTTGICIDGNANYWITTLRHGVFVMPNIHLRKFDLGSEFLQLSQIEATPTHLLIGTDYGKIGVLNPTDQQFFSFDLTNDSRISAMLYVDEFKSMAISQDRASTIWQIPERKLVLFNNAFNSGKDFDFVPPNGFLHAGYMSAFTWLDPFEKSRKSNDFFKLQEPIHLEKPENMSGNKLTHLDKRSYTTHYSFRSNSNYISFMDELRVFDSLNSERVIQYQNRPIFASDIVETDDGIIWVSTYSNGVFRIENNEVTKHIGRADGLLSNQVSKLKEDGTNLWIVSSKGLQYFDRDKNRVFSLTKQSGLDTYFIHDIEIMDSMLYLATNQGLYAIHKNNCFKKLRAPEVYFTSVSIQEQDTLIMADYQLPYVNNSMRIQFNSNGFQSGENITYKYRISNLQDEWLSTEAGVDFVRYPSLPPGGYRFQVKAVNMDGLESVEPATINIRVHAPFWTKWWFFILLILGIGLALWYYYKQRFLRFSKEKQMLLEKSELDKKLVLAKIENLRSQMNPHFIFNALNSIQEYIVMNERELAGSYLVKFSRLIRIYLEHSRKTEVPLEEELSALSLYLELEKDRFEDAMDYSLKVDPNLNALQIKLPPLLLQPYVENALKHGLLHKKNNRFLAIDFEWDAQNKSLICRIKDNGVGREASYGINQKRMRQHRPFATVANENRVKLLNADRSQKIVLTINDLYGDAQEALGTEVIICIPQEQQTLFTLEKNTDDSEKNLN